MLPTHLIKRIRMKTTLASLVLLSAQLGSAFRSSPYHCYHHPSRASLELSAYALLPSILPSRKRRTHVLFASDSNDVDTPSSYEEPSYMPTTAQDLRQFLNQRTIQSFMYLLSSTRDLHTVAWLDNFTRPIIVNNYWADESRSNSDEIAYRESDKKYVCQFGYEM